ncbi:hypothetical protein FI667_g16770, partial [Globisporangium splendens]
MDNTRLNSWDEFIPFFDEYKERMFQPFRGACFDNEGALRYNVVVAQMNTKRNHPIGKHYCAVKVSGRSKLKKPQRTFGSSVPLQTTKYLIDHFASGERLLTLQEVGKQLLTRGTTVEVLGIIDAFSVWKKSSVFPNVVPGVYKSSEFQQSMSFVLQRHQ